MFDLHAKYVAQLPVGSFHQRLVALGQVRH